MTYAMDFLGIIPARYGSTRLKGKALADICGKTMIRRVYELASRSIGDLYVATDDDRIATEVESFGGRAIMTSSKHNSGTNRCLEAYQSITMNSGKEFQAIINIQGDEPLLDPEQIEILKECFADSSVAIATLATKVESAGELDNESEVFVVFDKNKNALYFSRSVIPYLKGVPRSEWKNKQIFYKHIGLYGYTPDALKIFAGLTQSNLEMAEGLEQNRWLENGRAIRIGITEHSSLCVDTQEDLEKVRKIVQGQDAFK
jgi:3-deoxy-manno-octulosonate cytidylyltransferase (CMP-KDO synthetase)